MTERERILALRDQGKITPQEADMLLDALNEVDEIDAQLDEVGAAADEAVTGQDAQGADGHDEGLGAALLSPPSLADPPTASEPPSSSSNAEAKTQSTTAEQGTLPERWVRVMVLAGDLDIRVDAALEAPVIDRGEAELEAHGQDFEIRQARSARDYIDRFFSGSANKDLDIRVPQGFGVELQCKAGDVDIEGVAYLKGELLAGDIDARLLGGIDVKLKAGDLDIRMRPSAGRHRVEALAGNVEVTFLSGSSVSVTGEVAMGDVHVPFPTARRGFTGWHFKGDVGGGQVPFEIKLKAGDLHVRLEEGGGA